MFSFIDWIKCLLSLIFEIFPKKNQFPIVGKGQVKFMSVRMRKVLICRDISLKSKKAKTNHPISSNSHPLDRHLLRCLNHYKSDLIINMDHMPILVMNPRQSSKYNQSTSS